jgi:hypothetical protein
VALRWGTIATFSAAGASLVWTVAGTVLSVPLPPLWVLAGGVGAAVLLTLVRGQLASRRWELLARLADFRMGTRERMSTAVDLAEGRIPATALAPRVMNEAAREARRAEPVRLRPGAPAAARWALALVALAAAVAWLIPGLTLPATPARQTAERIRQEGRRLEQAGRRLQEQARTTRAPQARRAAPEVQRLGRELQQQRLDRAAAQARIAALQHQLEAARRRIGERIGDALAPQTRPQPPDAFFRQPTDLDRSVRQLRELAARLAEMPVSEGERRDLAQQLSDLAQSGEGRLPAAARRQAEEAQRQLGAGNTAGAGEALRQALQELEALEAMMSDEQALRRTQRELEQSSERIARGGAGRGRSDQEPGADGPQAPSAPGAQRPQGQGGEEVPAPPEGPHEGSTPGQGKGPSKLGAPSPRLEGGGERSGVRGQEAPGQLQTSEILGPGRRESARTPVRALRPDAAAQADEHLARQRIPIDLRALVRRYFDLLGRQQ